MSWHSPATNNGAPIDSYRVTPLLDGDLQAPKVFKSIQTHQVMSGLAHGHHYTFVVAAHNSRGWGADSSESAAIIVK